MRKSLVDATRLSRDSTIMHRIDRADAQRGLTAEAAFPAQSRGVAAELS